MQTPIPTPTRSPRKDLSSDKTIFEELIVTVSPTAATTSKSKRKRGFTSNKTKILPGSIAGMCRRRGQIRNHIKTKFVTREFFKGKIREVLNHYNSVVPEMTFTKTNEMIKEEMPRRVYLAVNKDREIAPINVPYSSTAEISTADLQHQLYLKMKSKIQDQAADPKLWEILKAKGRKGQKGIESYQIRVNLTAPTLTFPSIEAHEPYPIVDKPNTYLIYLNNKDEKWVMYLVEIVKFCDATLERVLNEVKLRIFENRFWKKPSLLGELDLDIMKAFEREITKRLRHREHVRRWESFVNRRPILPTMKRL
ncbi:hypothetical protein Tco_0498848 [Tanacetum coccineum]